jgi:hypothetical protein
MSDARARAAAAGDVHEIRSCGRVNAAAVIRIIVGVAVLQLLLVAAELPVTAAAASCELSSLGPCMTAGREAIKPPQECCDSVMAVAAGTNGLSCLCSLLTSDTAKEVGVNFRVAIGIPQRCGVAVPRGSKCNGMKVPGG